MTRFCQTHARERSLKELKDRERELLERQRAATLGPGLKKELENVRQELRARQGTNAAHA